MIVFSVERFLDQMAVTFFRMTWKWLSIGVIGFYGNLKRENSVSYMSQDKKNQKTIQTECRSNGKALESVDKHKNVKVWVHSTLSWDYHITTIWAKARGII